MPLFRSHLAPLPPNLRHFRLLLVSAIVLISLAGAISVPVMRAGTQAPESTPQAPASIEVIAPQTSPTPLPPSPDEHARIEPSFSTGGLILAAGEGAEMHLFIFQEDGPAFTRLTSGAWNDITPALSPDGRSLAFASNRQGGYDLYLWSLNSNEVVRLTDAPGYEASPTWSPDGRWLAYESYPTEGSSLDIWVMPIDGSQPQIQLTDDFSADHSPAWSPQGRLIAFVSNRSGENEIWLADLDNAGERFTNISNDPKTGAAHPAWSPDGSRLAWVSTGDEGIPVIRVWDGATIQEAGSGSWPTWSSTGQQIFTGLLTPNRSYLAGYDFEKDGLAIPPIALPGTLAGMTALPQSSSAAWHRLAATVALETPAPLWQELVLPVDDLPAGRVRLAPLEGVKAPYPVLHDAADEAFQALRQRVGYETGWDFLATLENAYVALTSPLPPGMGADWLYTGRAFAFNQLPINAGWVVVVRENFGSQTYWRVYVRTRFQDGSQGAPLKDLPWNFMARYQGDPGAYEQGGAPAGEIPGGYWIDFTSRASAFGWERQPALVTWRSAVTLARFNEFVLDGGRDWRSAMLEIYPEQALYTSTPLPAPTRQATRTPWPSRTPVPTRTPWPTRTPVPSSTPPLP